MGGLDLDVSSDLGDLTNLWLVEEESAVDPVEEDLGVGSEGVTSEDWGLDSVGVGVVSVPGPWVDGLALISVPVESAVEPVSNGHLSLKGADVVLALDIVVDVVVEPVVGWDVLGNDLDLKFYNYSNLFFRKLPEIAGIAYRD